MQEADVFVVSMTGGSFFLCLPLYHVFRLNGKVLLDLHQIKEDSLKEVVVIRVSGDDTLGRVIDCHAPITKYTLSCH